MAAIQPVDLPQAAGIEYGKGDVRHFSPGDAVDTSSLQNPTRHLAERDNKLAGKLNEVIEAVNAQEQFVPLPIIRTILPPMQDTVVANYRIPVGFESRVLNAVVAATPQSSDIELDIYYNTTFGGVSGTAVVSTASEYSGGVSFYQTGEFVIALKNKSGITLEMVASVLLTLRPIGAPGSLLVASVVQGQRGLPGPTGPRGPGGPPGTGGAGSPGMIWTGTWSGSTAYAEKSVVRFSVYGSLPSSFIALQANVGQSPQSSYVGAANVWDLVALGGQIGATGSIGSTGSVGGAPTFALNTVVAHGTAGVDFVGSNYDSDYLGSNIAPNSQFSINCREGAVVAANGTNGMAVLTTSARLCFRGHGTFVLPQTTDGGYVNWQNSMVNYTVTPNGSVESIGSLCASWACPTDVRAFVVRSPSAAPQPVEITVVGVAQF
jgi:hypothetical protein